MKKAKEVWLLLALVAGCGVRQLPPPPPPSRVLASIETGGPPAPGRGRVLLDVEGDRALVEDISGGSLNASGAGRVFSGSLEVSQRLCVTPCYVDLRPGPHTLRFRSIHDSTRTGDGYVNIDTGVSAYRLRLGVRRRHMLKRALGITSTVLGGLFIVAYPNASQNDSSGANTMLLTGVGLAVVGSWMIGTSTSIEQPGNGVQWPVATTTAGQ